MLEEFKIRLRKQFEAAGWNAAQIIEVSLVGRTLYLQIDATGLNLNAKIQWETQILRQFKSPSDKNDPQNSYDQVRIRFLDANAHWEPPPSQGSAPPVRLSGLDLRRRAIPGVRRVIVVAAGKGGVGKSFLSSNLAVAFASLNRRVGLLDADVYGPSQQQLFGIAKPLAVGQNNKLLPAEAHGVKLVSFGLLSATDTPIVWRGPLVAKAIEQFAYDVEWGELDDLIIDLPPGTGDVQLTILERLPVHAALFITTPQRLALLDVAKAVSMMRQAEVPILGVVANMVAQHCSACGHENPLFPIEPLQEFLGQRALSCLAKIPFERWLAEAAEAGVPSIAARPDSAIAGIFRQLAKAIC